MKNRIALFGILLSITMYSKAQNNFSVVDSIQIYTSGSEIERIDSTYHLHVYRYNSTRHEETKMRNIHEWTYVAVTKEGLKGKMYFNGELVQERNWQDVSYNLSSLWIGRNQYWKDFYFKGWLDDLKMSNIAKTPEEILNYYNSNKEFTADANTVGLWHFNETSGTTFVNEAGGSGTLYGSPIFTAGKFGNAIYFDGINDYGNCNVNPPEANRTTEFWIKFDGFENRKQVPVISNGIYAVDFNFIPTIDTVRSEISWSTGDTTSSITINPNTDTLIWVKKNGIVDTMIIADRYHDIIDTTRITIMDTTYVTVTDSISVTDTLIIDAVFSNLVPPYNINSIKVYPNPARDHLYINTGYFGLMVNHKLKIINQLGATVFETFVDKPLYEINLSDWTGKGVYFIQLIDSGGMIQEIKKIILQ